VGDRDKSDSASERTRNIGASDREETIDHISVQATVAATPTDGVAVRAASEPTVDAADRVLGGRYQLRKQLGIGGFGAVYEAEDKRLQKRVAVKVLNSVICHSDDMVARFRGEAIAASKIGHEGIVDVTDFDRDPDGSWFIVMELLDGMDLADIIVEDGALPLDRALSVCAQTAFALEAAHAKDIIHRDLKPANIYVVARESREDFVKVIDFGISKMMTQSVEAGGLTSQGVVLGTPSYMAPEQASGERDVDGRADVYALGIILYEVLTGKPPFTGDTYLKILAAQLKENAAPLADMRPSLGRYPQLETLVKKALTKDREDRYRSMRAFGEAILEVLAEVEPAAADAIRPIRMRTGKSVRAQSVPPTGMARKAKRAGRSAMVWIGILGALAMVATIAVLAMSGGSDDDESDNGVTAPSADVSAPSDDSEEPAKSIAPVIEQPDPEPVAPIDAAPPLRTIKLTSKVRGARAFGADGEELGALPFEVPAPPDGETMTIVVKARNYKDKKVTVKHDSKPDMTVKLKKNKRRTTTGGGSSGHDDSISREW
jgi:serine/threonine-protein kinase